MSLVGGLLLAGLLLAPPPPGKKLPEPARREIEARLREYAKAPREDDAARAAIFPLLFVHGRAGVEFVETSLASKPGLADAAADVRSRAREILGLDLLEEKTGPAPDLSPGWFTPGEIVVMKKPPATFAGFLVLPASKPDSGEIAVSWWSQSGAVKLLAQPGGAAGTAAVKGVAAAKPIRPNTGWTEYDYAFDAGGIPVEIRFAGPNLFKWRYPEGVSVGLAGARDPKTLSSADESIAYSAAYPEPLARIAELLPKYLFRSVPGCEPLPLEGDERAAFAQYEAVQVDVRATRGKGEPIVLVKFLEIERTGFKPWHRRYIVNFVNEIAPVPDERVIVMAGASPGLEGNRFMAEKGETFERPPKKLVELLRANFPEGS